MAYETDTRTAGITPSQTVGPFFHDALLTAEYSRLVPNEHAGAIRIRGRVYDGAGEPVPDAMVEIWQADSQGEYHHRTGADNVLAEQEFTGFGRSGTGPDGAFEFVTVKPGPALGADGETQAPHILVSVFARGLLRQLHSRIYFPEEEEANAADPVLLCVDESRRKTLIATAEGPDLRFDIRLQEAPDGEPETVFLDV